MQLIFETQNAICRDAMRSVSVSRVILKTAITPAAFTNLFGHVEIFGGKLLLVFLSNRLAVVRVEIIVNRFAYFC